MKESNKRKIIKRKRIIKKMRSIQNDSNSVFTRLFIQPMKK